MADFNTSGPIITLATSESSLSVAALPVTTTREPTRRTTAGALVSLSEEGFVLPTSGQIWPLGLV